MARTPVPTEVIEKPKRTPVVIDEVEKELETVADTDAQELGHGLVEKLMEASENGAMDAKPHCEIAPIIDGFRMCAREKCGASFKPRSINPKDDDVTEYYCSSDCAIHEFYRKRGLGPVPEKIVSGASQASSRAHREEKKRKRIEAAPALLEALETIANVYQRVPLTPVGQEILVQARAAIALAKEETK